MKKNGENRRAIEIILQKQSRHETRAADGWGCVCVSERMSEVGGCERLRCAVIIVSIGLVLSETHVEASQVAEVHLVLRPKEQATRGARRVRGRARRRRHRNAADRATRARGQLLEQHGHVGRRNRKHGLGATRAPRCRDAAALIRRVFVIRVFQTFQIHDPGTPLRVVAVAVSMRVPR